MGAWGYEEHDNDDFLDFVEDDTSVENLLKKVSRCLDSPEYFVGIVNRLSPEERKKLPLEQINDSITYLNKELEYLQDSSWRDKKEREIAINTQIERLESIEKL